MRLDLTQREKFRKNPTFDGWITGRMAAMLYVRKYKPLIARSIQNHRVSGTGPMMEHLVELC
jgi:hypothetical protein